MEKRAKNYFFQLNFALAQLTDKRDPMYYTSKRPSESHNDGHPKKIRVAILDFVKKKGKKPPRGLVVLMKSDGLITYWA